MAENLLLSLEITALGMGLVFIAIVLLWGMMWMLTAIRFKNEEYGSDSPEAGLVTDNAIQARAAAVAVAVGLAKQSQSTARPLTEPPTAIVSAWQLGMRTRQMYEKGEKR